MKIVETDHLQVVYFDPGGDYLVPYVTQCFLNVLAAQKARFGFVPDGKVSMLLQDFSDRGNAAAMLSAPRDRILHRHRADRALVRDVQSRRTRLHARQS